MDTTVFTCSTLVSMAAPRMIISTIGTRSANMIAMESRRRCNDSL